MLKRVLSSFMIVLLALSCAYASDPSQVGQANQIDVRKNSHQLTRSEIAQLRKMPLRQKIGQMLMIGFDGTEIDQQLSEHLTKLKPGALIIFGRNVASPNQLSKLIRQAQLLSLRNSHLPLLIGTDQEGGDVIRIKTPVPLPSALAFGGTQDSNLVRAAGALTGKLLTAIGVNMNLAPVLDVSDPRSPMFIGTRTYGSAPEAVGKLGIAFAQGLAETGVLPTAKHFPGHGNVVEDSHAEIPRRLISLEELEGTDLKPFQSYSRTLGQNGAIMVGHVSFPSVDSTGAPATQSKKIIQEILRQRLAFNGIVLTDDISMGGENQALAPDDRAIAAISAGADMIMVAWGYKRQQKIALAIERAIRSGKIPVARIEESIIRIAAAKKSYAQAIPAERNEKEIDRVLNDSGYSKLADAIVSDQFKRSKVEAQNRMVFFPPDRPIYIFSSNSSFVSSFKEGTRDRSVRAYKLRMDKPIDIARILNSNPRAIGVFYLSGYQAGKLAADLDKKTANRIFLISVESKSILPNAEDFAFIAESFYRHPKLGRHVARTFFSHKNK